ncbi:HipA domain-containing protein [Malonomonas rubra]|uniref:HipA domain-containing protein n=1 Tax=Malonomonas rubra TaxID=57040 RepID=UPI0026ED3287|nr:HipA domain-containing protein [Malonomonas rubra]
MREKQQQELRQLLSDKAHSSRDLIHGLNVSQPTLSRLINSMKNEIVVMGKGRSTCYGLPRAIHDSNGRFPVYSIDPRGDATLYGNLTALQGGQYWWEGTDGNEELFSGQPWFLLDLQLSGFGARSFAYRRSELLKLPRKLADWSEDDMLYATSKCGEDRIGNLLVGEDSLSGYFKCAREMPPAIELDSCNWKYPQLAQKTLAGEMNSAQIGGEQPKFSACIDDKGTPCHMIVKFSPAVDSNEAQRYSDLLVCEHLALEAIRLSGFSSARSRLIIAGSQAFLALKRFDRRGALGRLPMISLRALHARLQAPYDNWIDAAIRLEQADLINREDSRRLRWFSLFSDLIGNTNQHFGNISLIPHKNNNCYLLAPLYGARPTLYEPVAGEIPIRLFTPPPVRNDAAAELPSALETAILFWKSAAVDERISADFRQICYENCELLKLSTHSPRLLV